MARKRANITDLLNNLTFKCIYNKFRLISMNEFKWEGLPEGILERHIESWLFADGKAIFYRPESLSYTCLRCEDAAQYNVYGDPLYYNAVGFNFRERVSADDCVIIENNMLRLSTEDFVMFYVNKLTEAERTMDVNVKSSKTPILMLCDDKDVFSMKTIFRKIDGNEPAIFADKKLNPDSIAVLDLKAKFLGNELMDYKRSVENELLTFLGINNTPVDKKERLITDEATANNQLIDSFCMLQLEARQRACEDINAKYGLNISVSRRNGNVENPVDSVEEGDNVPVQ